MKTTEDKTTEAYTTVVEIFVPDEVIGNKTAALGFAFKTCDQGYTSANEIKDNAMKFNGDPWWCFKGRLPKDLNSRFILE